MNRKCLFLLAGLIALGNVCHSQSYKYDYSHRFCISLGGGVTTLYGDLSEKNPKGAGRLNIDYNFTPFFSAGIEAQAGKISEGAIGSNTKNEGLYMESNFSAIHLNTRVSAGQFMGESQSGFTDFISGIYVGTGIGFINGSVGTIIDTSAVTKKPIKGTITKQTSELIIPVNIGINYNLPVNGLALNLNYQYNISRGETLDGYDFYVNNNKKNDVFSFVSLAIRYYISSGRHRY